MATDNSNLRGQVMILIQHAPDMRRAGIRKAHFGDVIVDLEPFFDEPELLPETEPEKGERPSPFDDGDTYGEGGEYIPGFSRLRDRSE